MSEAIGWASALVLALTISSQVYTQWRSKSCAGVSGWLFIGQIMASIGFVVYSYMLDSWVFVWTNTFNLVAALVGQSIYMRNKRGSQLAISPRTKRAS
ncbi:hypothetical protein EDC30_11232 [Paucimonas lemoignei]|uniref:PQ loop repeat protein n=1 Tax=Paucimonas lemoignei TaxID=29443 RepID=A0A4R3HT59_PAULE|nr:hypothetical protein [Paucimonas lemoignei]TCS34702.1 hypothetical protein EDC30_11232 [Paucimonas lemoignei]